MSVSFRDGLAHSARLSVWLLMLALVFAITGCSAEYYRKSADRGYDINSLSEEDRHRAEIHVAKHRNGPTGVMNLYFDEETVSFKNLDRTYSQQN